MYLDSTNSWKVQVNASYVHVNDTNVPVALFFNFGTAKRADGQDIVITTPADVLIPRTVHAVGDGTFSIYLNDPAQSTLTGGTELRIQWGGASVNVANDVTTWQNCHGGTDDYVLVVHGEESSANLTDESGNYTATDANITYAQTGEILKAPSFNGANSQSNFGDVTQLNSVSEYTLMMWVRKLVSNDAGIVFNKNKNASERIIINFFSDAKCYINIDAANVSFDYSSFAGSNFFHFTNIFNGNLVGNTNRAKACINGTSQSLASSGTIPATTANMAAISAIFGHSTSSLDGRMDEIRLFSAALSENQCKTQYDNQRLFDTNGSLILNPILSSGMYRKYW